MHVNKIFDCFHKRNLSTHIFTLNKSRMDHHLYVRPQAAENNMVTMAILYKIYTEDNPIFAWLTLPAHGQFIMCNTRNCAACTLLLFRQM